jgi:hypothetical protein
VVWEAAGQEPFYGTVGVFTPINEGATWIEAEAAWPDGRRVFASSSFLVTNRPPTVTVTATDASAGRVEPEPGMFTFARTGNTNFPISVSFIFGGTAASGVDYQTPAGSVNLPAGITLANLPIVPVAGTNLASAKTVIVALSANPAYVVGTSNRATITISGNSGPITSTTFQSGVVTLTWASGIGKTYQVLSKNKLSDTNWTALSQNIVAAGALTTWLDTTAGTQRQRFYRVAQVSP